MDYPFWDTGVPYGVLMASIAVLHVFVSHFAIGGGLYLVVAERSARRRGDEARLAYLQRLSRFFMLLTIVFGALSGVGIWFVIGLISPTATEALIHNFVWGWAIEWTFFLVEVLAAILYYYGWRRLDARSHLRIGWIYFVAAWLSLVVINGIVTFMLTPGAWLQTGAFWDGFFNPTYGPSLVLRTGVCIGLAGLFAWLVASRIADRPARERTVRFNAVWVLAGVLTAVLGGLWYGAALPASVADLVGTRLRVPAVALSLVPPLVGVLTVGALVAGLLVPRFGRALVATLLLVAGLGAFGAFETWRESARKPWVLTGYIYGSGIEASRLPTTQVEGLLPHLAYRTGDDGADLFRHACRSCHTLDGAHNPLSRFYDRTDAAFIEGTLRGLHVMRTPMPPFPGNPEERSVLAAWLWARMDQRPLEEGSGLEGVALGRRVYEARCASCHEVGGHNDKTDSVRGLTEEDLVDLLATEGLADEMPDFSGTEVQRRALILYLLSLGEEHP